MFIYHWLSAFRPLYKYLIALDCLEELLLSPVKESSVTDSLICTLLPAGKIEITEFAEDKSDVSFDWQVNNLSSEKTPPSQENPISVKIVLDLFNTLSINRVLSSWLVSTYA